MPGPSQLAGTNLPGLFALLVVVGIVLLPVLFTRGRGHPSSDGDPGEEGGNGPPGPPDPPSPPRGGGDIPLDDAEPARLRLRDEHRRSIRGPRTRQRRRVRT